MKLTFRLYRNQFKKNFDEDLTTDMYILGRNMLVRAGFIHYEVSSFFRNHGVSYHNLLTWNGHDYIGKSFSEALLKLGFLRQKFQELVQELMESIVLTNTIENIPFK